MVTTVKSRYHWAKMLMILVIISIFSGLIGYYFKGQYQQIISAEQQKVNHAESSVELFLNGRLMALQMLAATDDVRRVNVGPIDSDFRAAMSLMGFSNIAFFNQHGLLLHAVSNGIPVKQMPLDNDAFQQALAGESSVSNRIMLQSVQSAYIYLVVPAYNEQGNIIGVLAAGVPIQNLNSLVKIKESSENNYFFVIDNTAQFLEHPRLNDVVEAESDIRSFTLHNYFSSDSGYVVIRSVLDSINKLYVFQSLDKTNWRIVSAIPLSEVYLRILKASLPDMMSLGFLMASVFLLYQITVRNRRHQEDMEKLRWERMKSVNQLAAGLAHEIRNPITSIKGFVQLMLRRPDHPPKPERLEIIIDEAERIEQLIGEFQLLAKPLKEPDIRFIPLGKMLQDVVNLMEGQASAKGAQLKFELRKDAQVLGDSAQLKQVWINLLRNAIDAVAPGQGLVKIGVQEKEGWIQIRIRDNGVGISKENMPKLATPFFTTKEGGTGLGLSICYSIVENHHGHIKVLSQEGKGTTFDVYLPKKG